MFDVDKLMKVMSEVLSDAHGVKITMTAEIGRASCRERV